MIDINHTDLKEFLWRYGYYSKYDSGKSVKQTDLPTLQIVDVATTDAIRAWQEGDLNFSVLSQVVHQRAVIADGDPGPVTRLMLDVPRCPLPDFAPPPGALFDYGDPDLNQAVKSMQAAATGSGSWPVGCYGTAGVHEITISYDESSLATQQREWLPEFKIHNAAAVGAMGLRVKEVPWGQRSNIRFYGKSYGGSTIGMAQFPSGTCGDSLFCTVSPNYYPSKRRFIILGMHEFGHNMGFEHSNGFIMNPSLLDVPEYWVRRDVSGVITYQDVRYAKGKQFFGGEQDGGTPPVDPPPPPTGDHNGIVVIDGVLYKSKFWRA